MTVANTTIGIHTYKLNIVRNLELLDLSWIEVRIPQKNYVNYVILLEEKLVKSVDSELEKIFSEIWNKHVLNVIIIYWNQTLSAVTFSPFPKLQLNFIEKNELTKIDVLFPDESRNLRGYPFKVTAFYDVTRAVFNRNNASDIKALNGVDGLLLHLIIEKLNATLNMSEPDDAMQIGELLPNRTATGCLADLMSGDFDMGLNMRFYRLEQFEGEVEATHSIGRDDICFLVPRKGKTIDIVNIFRPFQYFTWIAISVFLFGFVLIYRVLTIGTENVQSFEFHFFQFFGYTLQQTIPFLPESRRQRILIAFWTISALFLALMYQGKLSGPLIIPKDQPNINNIEELAYSDLKIIAFPRYNAQIIQFFNSKYNGTFQPLFIKLVNSSIGEFYEQIAKFDPSYGFAHKNHINSYLRRIYTLESSAFFHQVEQCPIPYLGVYGIRYGTPYEGRINFIIRQAQESGLITRWERGFNSINVQNTQAILNSGQQSIPFSLVHLQTAFYIYFMGCVIALSAFCLEILYKYFTTQKLY